MTITVFVPEDLAYIGLDAENLRLINPRLVPLIAHDRAGFGGGVLTCGVLVLFIVWCGEPARGRWQALALAGGAGFLTAIGIHPLVGYTDAWHLAPAVGGAVLFAAGLWLSAGVPSESALSSRSRLVAQAKTSLAKAGSRQVRREE